MFRHYSIAGQGEKEQTIIDTDDNFESTDLNHACCVQESEEKAVEAPSQAPAQETRADDGKEVMKRRSKLNLKLGMLITARKSSIDTAIASTIPDGCSSSYQGPFRGLRHKKVLKKMRSHQHPKQ